MRISRKKWQLMEKKVADLEKKIHDQPLEIISAIYGNRQEQEEKASLPRHRGQ